MQLGKNVLAKSVNGGEGVMYELDVAPIALNGRTLVPVRAVSESFNCDVQWDGANNRVVITTGRQTAAVDENRVYFNPGHKTNDYTSGIFDGNTLYFNFVNRAMIYVYDGSSVRSFNAGDHPRDIIAGREWSTTTATTTGASTPWTPPPGSGRSCSPPAIWGTMWRS